MTCDGAVTLLLFGLDIKDLLTVVGAAVRTDVVRQTHASALLAFDKVHRLERILGAAPIAATLGQLTFWMRWHFRILLQTLVLQQIGQATPARVDVGLTITGCLVKIGAAFRT